MDVFLSQKELIDSLELLIKEAEERD